ncbi:MAG: hypothetical protein SWK76_13540 [Actinomycetota bacterium]|nr:hypothetical protein [Actinomycetota bacterium]
MSVTACMLLQGGIEMKAGLLGNVEFFPDPDKYFDELARRGFRLVKTAD